MFFPLGDKIKKWVDARAQKIRSVQAPESSSRWLLCRRHCKVGTPQTGCGVPLPSPQQSGSRLQQSMPRGQGTGAAKAQQPQLRWLRRRGKPVPPCSSQCCHHCAPLWGPGCSRPMRYFTVQQRLMCVLSTWCTGNIFIKEVVLLC